jgi:hypothetical protein
LRQLIENRLSQLTAETESLFVEARERVRREIADQLNQAVRRMRQAADIDELTATLAEAAGGFAAGTMVFRVDGLTAKSGELEIALDAAPALRGAIETRDPVIAAATPGEISAALMERIGQPGDGRVYVFPLVAREEVPALLCAWGDVQVSSVELLSQVAAASWSVLAMPAAPVTPPPEVDGLIQIVPAESASEQQAEAAVESRPAWDRLPAEEQQIHLRAQRFARVEVAEMRLFSTDAVRSGREKRDLYEALREPIDAARDSFRAQYFAACPSMVDYLHLELVRTLAHDDPELLGKEYPGPMV